MFYLFAWRYNHAFKVLEMINGIFGDIESEELQNYAMLSNLEENSETVTDEHSFSYVDNTYVSSYLSFDNDSKRTFDDTD